MMLHAHEFRVPSLFYGVENNTGLSMVIGSVPISKVLCRNCMNGRNRPGPLEREFCPLSIVHLGAAFIVFLIFSTNNLLNQ